MKAKTGFLIFFITLSLVSYSQKRVIRFEHFDISKGLSHNTVHCITQDSKGFLWIGTEDGLNMFDGYSFVSFKKDARDTNSITDNFISCLFEDKNHNLWIGTNNNGISCYNPFNRQFNSFKTYQWNGKSIPLRMVNAITEDNQGHIWFGSFDGLFEFDPKSEKIIGQFHPGESSNSLSDNEIRCLYMDVSDVLWIGTNKGGLNRFDLRDKRIIHYYNNGNDKNSISNNSISSVLRDKSGNLWVGTARGLNLLDEKTGKFEIFLNDPKNPYSISNNVIFCLQEDHLGSLWIGTLDGLNLFEKEKNIFYNWKFVPSENLATYDNEIFSILEDKYGQIWLGTFTKGLVKFSNKLKNFKLHEISANKDGSGNKTIREIYKDDNNQVWVGTLTSGAYIFNNDFSQLHNFRHNPSNPNSISDNRVNTIFRDSKGNYWIGTWDGGLNKLIPENGTYRFEHFFHNDSDSTSIASDIILEVTEDRQGRIWLGTDDGLDLFDDATKKAFHYKHKPDNPNSLVHNSIQSGCIIFDNSDNIWIGTWGGLTKIITSPSSHLPEKFIQYNQNDSAEYSLSDNRVISLFMDDKNHLWAGTFGGGLNKITLDTNGNIITIESFAEKNGLPNNVIYGILEDSEGYLWLSTNNGLSRFNPLTEQFDRYDEDDGLQSNQFYWGAACKFQNGELAFGGINGMNSFFANEILPDKLPPDIVITDFRIFDKTPVIGSNSVLNKNIIYADTINLSYNDNFISFEFSALQFADPPKNKYEYKLEGFNDSWISTDARKRFAVYTNLSPGEYTFRVKGSNPDGVWNENSKNIKIIIHPPFWKTRWFIFLMIILVILLLFGIYSLRVATLRKQKKQLEQTVKEKTSEIILQKQELETTNEELKQTNEELYSQREELDATIQSLKDAQKQVIQSEKMASLGVLSAGVAHEINNPLNFIHGGILYIENYFRDNLPERFQEVKPVIEGINTGVRRTSEIVKSLNQYNSNDTLPFKNCNLHDIIDDCLVILQNQYKNRIEVDKHYTLKEYTIEGNEGKLHQVFLNILANASQAIGEQGKVTIKTNIAGKDIHISITDNGIGISPENLKKIFDPFFTTKDPGKGTGLGLAITYNIIQEHKGILEFESQIGQGTEVLIKLPLKKKSL